MSIKLPKVGDVRIPGFNGGSLNKEQNKELTTFAESHVGFINVHDATKFIESIGQRTASEKVTQFLQKETYTTEITEKALFLNTKIYTTKETVLRIQVTLGGLFLVKPILSPSDIGKPFLINPLDNTSVAGQLAESDYLKAVGNFNTTMYYIANEKNLPNIKSHEILEEKLASNIVDWKIEDEQFKKILQVSGIGASLEKYLEENNLAIRLNENEYVIIPKLKDDIFTKDLIDKILIKFTQNCGLLQKSELDQYIIECSNKKSPSLNDSQNKHKIYYKIESAIYSKLKKDNFTENDKLIFAPEYQNNINILADDVWQILKKGEGGSQLDENYFKVCAGKCILTKYNDIKDDTVLETLKGEVAKECIDILEKSKNKAR